MSGYSQGRFSQRSSGFARGDGRVIVSFQKDYQRSHDDGKDRQSAHVQHVAAALRKLKKISLTEGTLKEYKEQKYFISNSEKKAERLKNARKKQKMDRSQKSVVTRRSSKKRAR